MDLPPDIGSCYSLKTLNVSSNQLKVLPDEIAQLLHLENFFFYSNRIVNVPEWVSGLPLTAINGFNNKILKMPFTLGKLRDLEEANFAANVMMQLQPEVIESWRYVRVLNLYECRLLKLCSLANLESLEELRLFSNNLEEVPDLGSSRISKLKSARRASRPAHCAQQHTLSPSATSLNPPRSAAPASSRAPVIELNKNRISVLPLSFFQTLRNLEKIVLNNNLIESIPVGINCPKLESFLISCNYLTELPPDLPLWTSLRVLFVNNNQLTRLPETFLQNTIIERINLARNNKCAVPSKHILQHLKKQTEKVDGGKYFAPDTL